MLIGGKPILRPNIRILATVALPLLLGGCGLPIGIQIASLLADGVSFITTEKTLTDHGISIVAKKDCAMWRGLKGDDICHNADIDALNVAAIDEPLPVAPTPGETALFESEPSELIAAPDTMLAEITPEDTPTQVAASDVEVIETVTAPVPVPPILEIVAAAPEPAVEAATVEPAVVKPQGGAFLIIASYHRAADADRFARSQDAFETFVLAGRAKGRSVYRVAVGPVAKAERDEIRTGLLNAGFADVWMLRQSNPNIIIQLAAID